MSARGAAWPANEASPVQSSEMPVSREPGNASQVRRVQRGNAGRQKLLKCKVDTTAKNPTRANYPVPSQPSSDSMAWKTLVMVAKVSDMMESNGD